MKKLLSILLVLTMMLTLVSGAFAFADEELIETAPDDTVIVKNNAPVPGNEPEGEPAGETGDEPEGEPAGETGDEPEGEPAGETGDEPGGEPAGETGDEPEGEPAGETGDEPGDEPAGETGDEPGDEPAGETGDEPGDEPAGETGDESEDEPSEQTEEDSVEALSANAADAANGFANGGKYLISIGGQFLTAGGQVKSGDAENPTEDMIWTAETDSRGSSLQDSNGQYLVYNSADPGAVTVRGTAAHNWSYSGGQMIYDKAGTKYYITDAFETTTNSSAAASSIVIYVVSEATGGDDADEGDDTGGDTGDTGDTSDTGSDGFSAWKGPFQDVADETQIAISLGGKTIQFGKGSVGTTDAVISGVGGDSTMTIDGNYVILKAHSSGSGYAFYLNDPPGSIDYLYVDGSGNVTHTGKDGAEPSGYWTVNEGGGPSTTLISYTDGGVTWYLTVNDSGVIVGTQDESAAVKGDVYSGTASSDPGGAGDSGETVDADAPVFDVQPESLHYVLVDSGYAAPTYTVTVSLPEGSAANNIYLQWFVNGQAYGEREKIPGPTATSTITIPELQGMKAGVYPVYCQATCNLRDESGEPVEHTSTSYTTNFIVCSGVKPNSILTFSDVHETWNNVGQAIYDTIIAENGLIPALVIATGDYNNDYVAGFGEDLILSCIDTMIFRISLQLGGIDTVWVSGNHDNGYAAAFTNANINAGFGAVEEDYIDIENGISGTGIIYDSRTAVNADSSAANEGLIVIGVNYEDAGSQGAYANPSTGRPADPSKLDYGAEGSTGTVYEHLKKALDSAAEGYNGELVVISTHSGLHTVGVDPDSAAAGASAWSGGIDYSITNSAAIVALINSYVEKYDMDILFLFGHDHSKGESEFIKTPGDTITATVSYADQTTEDIELLFTYAHAGYITNTIGGQENYSYITYDDETINRAMNVADGNQSVVEALSATIERLEHPDDTTGDDTTGGDTTGTHTPASKPSASKPSTSKPSAKKAPQTGDDTPIALWVVMLILCGGTAAVILPRKKHN